MKAHNDTTKIFLTDLWDNDTYGGPGMLTACERCVRNFMGKADLEVVCGCVSVRLLNIEKNKLIIP